MTIEEIIRMTDETRINTFSEEIKTRWIAELDGKLVAEVFHMALAEFSNFAYSWPENKDTEPMAKYPHDDIYRYWLMCKIDFAVGEYNRYENDLQMFNALRDDFVTWFANTYAPERGYQGMCGKCQKPYYISAYGLAVKMGYKGTLDQWLESLRGDGVEMKVGGNVILWRWKPKDGESSDEWKPLLDISDVSVNAEIARSSAKIAREAADDAISAKDTAESNAAAAAEAKEQSLNSETAAAAAKERAEQIAAGIQSLQQYGVDKTLSLDGYAAEASVTGRYTDAAGIKRFTLINGSYLKANYYGEQVTISTAAATSYSSGLFCRAGEIVHCFTQGTGIACIAYAETNSAEAAIAKAVSTNTSEVVERIYTVEKDGYIFVSARTAVLFAYVEAASQTDVVHTITDDRKTAADRFDALFGGHGYLSDVTQSYALTNGQHYGNVGETIVYSENTYMRSTRIEKSDGISCVVIATAPNSISSYIQYVDENDVVVKRDLIAGSYDFISTYKVSIAFPVNACAAYISGYVSSQYNAKLHIYKYESKEIVNQYRHRAISNISRLGICDGYPENTIIGFARAAQMGFDTIVCDVSYTSDGVPMCSHDNDISRVARTSSAGTVSGTTVTGSTFDKLMQYDYGIYCDYMFRGTKMASFEDAVKFAKAFGVNLIAEFKFFSENYSIPETVKMVQRYGMADNVIWLGGMAALRIVQRTYEKAKLMLYTDTMTEATKSNLLELKTDLNEVYWYANASSEMGSDDEEFLLANKIRCVAGDSSNPKYETIQGVCEYLNANPICCGFSSRKICATDALRNNFADMIANLV